MKKYFTLLILLLSSLLVQSQNSLTPGSGEENPPAFKWEEEVHDFGQIPYGVPATTRFYFINTGTTALVIETAKPSCHCTTPDWSKEPVKPGDRGFIEASYKADVHGFFTKNITVISNAATPSVVLTIKGEVLNKELIKPEE